MTDRLVVRSPVLIPMRLVIAFRVPPRRLQLPTLFRGAWLAVALGVAAAPSESKPGSPPATPSLREYRDFALGHDGSPVRGRALFEDVQRLGCARCHSVDGGHASVGPDLQSVGDKFPRAELIRALLEPSASIAVGYGTTTVETKAGEEYIGIIKEAAPGFVELAGADGKRIRLPLADVREQRGSTVSLMPEGLQSGLSREEFADLIGYLASLKQPAEALASNRGMPSEIPALVQPVTLEPFLAAPVRWVTNEWTKAGRPNSGLVWFGQLPGVNSVYVAAHQSGTIWCIDKSGTAENRTVFADLTREVFNERGPNGLLGFAFHPKFRENRRYFVKHQVFEGGRILTVVTEREASPDLRGERSDSASRRIWQVASTTQDHSGGCLGFGPDGYLYIAMGDTGPQQDPQGHGQDLTTHLAKVLRIDVDRSDSGKACAIPSDNPFQDRTDVLPEIWALGFREPWRFSFDAATGDLWVGDVGQDRVEEVSIVRRGENLGWNVYEGFEPFSNRYRKERTSYVAPVFAYRRKFGNSITGGYVYRGDSKSSFYGVYLCGDFTSRRIFGLKQRDRVLEVVRQIGTAPQGIASFGTDDRGEIYLVGYEGMVYHLNLAAGNFAGEAK